MRRIEPSVQSGGSKVPGTASFSKFMIVLQFVADDPGRLSVPELYKRVNFPRGTSRRILSALMNEGLIVVDERTERLELGPRLINLASRAWNRFDLRTIAQEDIRWLRDSTSETVHLAVPSGLEMVYIDKLEGLRAVRMRSRIGARIPLHSTSVGKAYMAALEVSECKGLLDKLDYYPLTPNTLARHDLESDLRDTARRGYSMDREETELDIICFGCAIRGATGRPVGSLSVTVPKYRLDKAAERTCKEGVVVCASRISTRISAVTEQDAL